MFTNRNSLQRIFTHSHVKITLICFRKSLNTMQINIKEYRKYKAHKQSLAKSLYICIHTHAQTCIYKVKKREMILFIEFFNIGLEIIYHKINTSWR